MPPALVHEPTFHCVSAIWFPLNLKSVNCGPLGAGGGGVGAPPVPCVCCGVAAAVNPDDAFGVQVNGVEPAAQAPAYAPISILGFELDCVPFKLKLKLYVTPADTLIP